MNTIAIFERLYKLGYISRHQLVNRGSNAFLINNLKLALQLGIYLENAVRALSLEHQIRDLNCKKFNIKEKTNL